MLRDKLIQGLLDKALKERLIRETSKKARALQEVVSECKTTENSKVQASVMKEKLTVNALKNFKNYWKQSINNQKNEFNCTQCGKKHEKKCLAFGTKCRNCDGRNHWAKMCRTQSKRKNMAARRVNAIEEKNKNSDTISIGELKSVNELDAKETNCVWYEKILVNKNAVMFKLDTGSQVNVIPKSELLKWVEKPLVRNCKIAVLDYSDNRVPILGECYLNCETKRYRKTYKFLVTSLNSCPILGLETCRELGLIQRLNTIYKSPIETPELILKEFADVFTGTGRLKRIVKIKLKENSVLHVAAPR
ncbi:reverse transcriptase domain-containing protein [Trichonephila inaurata madagascariensis]|uniref:Reverse transcriptase domain-containing protein n=1 Tax=Trichonephila inaurata madagascariensis TaxID=2747483 RepID=A0A8X6I827_9ARAC|nr:reverse transcriptase domain-containing protein [Trichonephila inaurata madagascariensis]